MAKKADAGYGADSISVLEGLEAVRKRPGMYIGSVSRKGLNHLVYEIVDNAVDEHLAGACDTIHVTLEKDGSCTVEDNGRGVPVAMHEKGVSAARLVFSTLHAGGKFGDGAYKTSGGLHGVGSSAVNALSTYMDVEISRDGAIHHDRYAQGKPVVKLEKGLLPIIGKTKKTGTKIRFLPDPEIFEKTRFREEDIKSRLHETAYLNPELTIIYDDRVGRNRSIRNTEKRKAWLVLSVTSIRSQKFCMSRSILRVNRTAFRSSAHSSIPMSFMKTSWAFAITSTTPRAVHTSQDSRRLIRRSSIPMPESLVC